MLPSDHEAAAAKHHVVPAAAAVLSEAVVGSTPQAAEVVVHQDHDSEVVDVAERRVVGVVACYLSRGGNVRVGISLQPDSAQKKKSYKYI